MSRAPFTDGVGASPFETAKRKARYGHRDWLWWRDRSGSEHVAPKTAQSLKQMLLDCGTKRNWLLLAADSGNPYKGFWWLGINLLRNAKHGI